MKTRRLRIYVGKCKESNVFIIENSDIPGLHLEADTMEELVGEISIYATELMDAHLDIEHGTDVFIEVLVNRPKPEKFKAIKPRLLVEQDMVAA